MMKITRVFQDREVSFECIEKNQRMIETLICSICQDFFKNPFMTSCCHSFCEDCFIKVKPTKKCDEHNWCLLKECPLCRQIVHLRLIIKNINLKSSIDAIRVKCLQGTCDSKCSKEIFLEEMEHHLKNDCEHFLAVCKYNGCEVRNLLATRGEHELECLKNPNKKIHCPECLESVLAVLLDEHRKNDCPEGLVSCTATSFCKKKIKRCELEEHLKNESFEHVNLLNKLMDGRFELINKLEKELNEKEKKHSEEKKKLKKELNEKKKKHSEEKKKLEKELNEKDKKHSEEKKKLEKELNEKDEKHSDEKKRMKEHISSYFCITPKECSISTWFYIFEDFKKVVLAILDGKQKQEFPEHEIDERCIIYHI